MSRRAALPPLLGAALAGCAALGPPGYETASPEAAACARGYEALDEVVGAAGVRDGQYAPVAGFPYMRVDRLNASLRDRAARDEVAMRTFAEALAALDAESRRHELANLPSKRGALPEVREGCARLLLSHDLADPGRRAALLERAMVPDDYSSVERALGLYALTRIPFASGVRRWEEETRAAFGGLRVGEGDSVRFTPAPAAPLSRAEASHLLARRDPLGRPLLEPADLMRFASAYAPAFEIRTAGAFDRFGRLRWGRDGDTPEVDTAEPVVYVHPAHTRYRDAEGGDRILLQLVYTLWFSERPPSGGLDLLAGRLDGVVWRVTLSGEGEPLLYDSMHACGCYHMFFPTPRARPRPAPNDLDEWAFVPLQLPRVGEGEQPVLKIAPRTHYLEGVEIAPRRDAGTRYVLRDYDGLRSLARPEGGSRSVFRPDGLVAGTERAERLLFWPMGISSAGAMRQRGRHATAFVGRRHFDDADLIERRFELEAGAATR